MQWSETGRTMDELKPSEPVVEVPRRWIPVASAVWLVPIVALAIALGVAWRSYSDRGPLIEILFDSASGIVAGETTVRYKDFAIGMVEDVRFTDDLSQVVVSARLHKDAARHVDSNTKFWLVRAQVGPRGISGLETVLSGAFIGAELGDAPGAPQDHFTALSAPPLTPAGQPGLRIRLSAPDGGSLSVGAPILFKQIPVGKIEAVELTEAGDVMVTAFVDAPNDRRLTSATRFWNASGFSIELGTGGASLNADKKGESIKGITKNYPHWFARNYAQDNLDGFDQHMLLALIAPRPILLGNARRDVWSDPNGAFRAALGADPVYALYGARGLDQKRLKPYDPAAEIAFWIRPGTHGVVKEDWPAFLQFLQAHFAPDDDHGGGRIISAGHD